MKVTYTYDPEFQVIIQYHDGKESSRLSVPEDSLTELRDALWDAIKDKKFSIELTHEGPEPELQ